MYKRIGLIISVVLPLIISSCSTMIFIGKSVEPEIKLEKSPRDIAFINLFDYSVPVYVKDKNEVTYHAGVMKFIDGLSTLSEDKSYSFNVADTLLKGIRIGELTTLLDTGFVSSVCRQFNSNLLMSLDSMNIYFDWETIVETDEKGNKSRTKNFYLYTAFYTSLYNSAGELLNRSQVGRSTFYKSRPTLSAIITIEPSLSKAREEVEELAYLSGKDYTDKFYSKIVQEPRKIHLGKQFRESNSYIKSGNWDKAEELLLPLQNSPDPKISKKAGENLSVVREAASSRNQ